MKQLLISRLCLATMAMGVSLATTAMADNAKKPGNNPRELQLTTKGLPNGTPVEVKITSAHLKANLGFEAEGYLKLKNLTAGNYKIELPEIDIAGYSFSPITPQLRLKLNKDAKIIDRDSKEITTNPLSFNYALSGMPPMVSFDPVYPFGTYGLYSCDPFNFNGCTYLDATSVVGTMGSIAVGNNRVYTSNTTHIYSCDPVQLNTCFTLYTTTTNAGKIAPMIYANGRVYAGLNNGILLSCDPNVANNCFNLDNAGSKNGINSLSFGENNRLYAGISNGILWSCDPNVVNSCINLNTAGGPIAALAYGNGRLYAGIDDNNGTLWSCDPNAQNSCQDLDQASSNGKYRGLIYANNHIYAGLSDNVIWSCDATAVNSCSNFTGGNITSPFVSQYSNGRLYVVTQNNSVTISLLSCDPTKLQCAVLDSF
jgi:hypothetical protein